MEQKSEKLKLDLKNVVFFLSELMQATVQRSNERTFLLEQHLEVLFSLQLFFLNSIYQPTLYLVDFSFLLAVILLCQLK